MRVLERAGLIRLAETTRVRGVTEKRYVRVARQFRPCRETERRRQGADDETSPPPAPHGAGRGATAAAATTDPSMSFVVRARMPAARAKRFAELIDAIAAEFADGAPGDGGDVRLRRGDLRAGLGRQCGRAKS